MARPVALFLIVGVLPPRRPVAHLQQRRSAISGWMWSMPTARRLPRSSSGGQCRAGCAVARRSTDSPAPCRRCGPARSSLQLHPAISSVTFRPASVRRRDLPQQGYFTPGNIARAPGLGCRQRFCRIAEVAGPRRLRPGSLVVEQCSTNPAINYAQSAARDPAHGAARRSLSRRLCRRLSSAGDRCANGSNRNDGIR